MESGNLQAFASNMGSGTGVRRRGIAMVRLTDGTTARAEVHWYEAHGIGKVKLKIKAWL